MSNEGINPHSVGGGVPVFSGDPAADSMTFGGEAVQGVASIPFVPKGHDGRAVEGDEEEVNALLEEAILASIEERDESRNEADLRPS